jgi:tetratricopeptide (TPR) repeat protein
MYGDALSFQGRFNEALQYYRDELAIFHKTADADPNDMNARMSLAGAFYDVGACLMRQGRLNDGLTLIRRARTIHEEVLARDVKSTVVLSILGEYRITEAETLAKMQRLRDALDNYSAARMIYDKILRLDAHNVDAQEMATAIDARIGTTLLAIEEPAQAGTTLAQAVKASEDATRAAFPDSEPIYTLAFAYSGLGDVASYLAARSEETNRRAKYWTEAKSWYESSLRVWRSIPNRQRFIDPNGFEIADLEPLQSALRRAVLNLERIGKHRS